MKKAGRKKLSSPKLCAALVIIAWLAMAVSLWGMTKAGSDAIEGTSCGPEDIKNKSVQLYTATPGEVLWVLNGDPDDHRPIASRDPDKGECIRLGIDAQVDADSFFLIAYSALSLALFLFVRAVRGGGAALLVLGLFLSLAMMAGDIFENQQVQTVIRLPPMSTEIDGALALLRYGSLIKWSALALSAALLGGLWRASRLVWIPRILGFAAAAAIGAGLVFNHWPTLANSLGVLGVFWLSALIHAAAVAVSADAEPVVEGKK